ncbi:MAG: ATP-binding protein [Chromatiaceae bacterium]
MLRTLYAKLALGLGLLLLLVGVLYAVLTISAARDYVQEVSQRFNRNLARDLVMDRDLVQGGQIDEAALKETFHEYMVINPSIEIYLLDPKGTILAYSADPGQVKRRRVSLAPIRAFLTGEPSYPLLGDDPRSHDRQKAFSVTPIPSSDNLQGYLYVVLRGERFDAVDQVLRDNYLLRLSSWSVAVSLACGLVGGLVVFRILTRRLHRLADAVDAFRDSDFTMPPQWPNEGYSRGDEIDRLGATFDQMAGRIVAQIQALKDTDNLRRELVAQVSHDLRTPLASLHGYLETLKLKGGDLTDPERVEYLAVALRQSDRLRRLVAELFELARLDAGEVKATREPFAVTELAQDVLQKLALRARAQAIDLRFSMGERLPFVSADIGLIERVLENLLDNALEHTPGGGAVQVQVERADGGVSLDVRDSGRGIPAADLPRIFERTYRAGHDRYDPQHGGLGLAIAKRILDLHGVPIEVKSDPGQGTSFRFVLPQWQGA